MRPALPCSKISRAFANCPLNEDKYWFPDIACSDWLKTLHFAIRDFKDESFINQFLSPKVMRDFHFFTVLDDDRHNYLEISATHNEEDYREIRQDHRHNIT